MNENSNRKRYNMADTIGANTPQTVQFSRAFLAELDSFRRKRSQWKKLCDAIKAEADREQLYAAASEAGCHLSELHDMVGLSRRARNCKAESAKLDAAERALRQAQKRLQTAEATLDKPGLSPNEIDAARVELEVAEDERDRLKLAVTGPRAAQQCVVLARSENLI